MTKFIREEGRDRQPREGGKRIGRPPRTSEATIVRAALELIAEEGVAALSIRRLSRRLGTAHTAIYTHFEGKDALLAAVAETAVATLWVDVQPGTRWMPTYWTYMHALRSSLMAQPHLIALVGLAAGSAAMLETVKRLAALLEAAGLDRRQSALQAQGVLWTVIGFVYFEQSSRHPAMSQRISRAKAVPGYEEMLEHLAIAELDPLFEATVERTVRGIEAIVDATRRKR